MFKFGSYVASPFVYADWKEIIVSRVRVVAKKKRDTENINKMIALSPLLFKLS